MLARWPADAGIVNEFALVYHLRHSFPLYFIVFKQIASHLSFAHASLMRHGYTAHDVDG